MSQDIVVFDPARIEDTATFERPLSYPRGAEFVLVNGKLLLERGTLHPAFPGKVLRKPPAS